MLEWIVDTAFFFTRPVPGPSQDLAEGQQMWGKGPAYRAFQQPLTLKYTAWVSPCRVNIVMFTLLWFKCKLSFPFQNWLDPAKEIKKQIRSKFFLVIICEMWRFSKSGVVWADSHDWCEYSILKNNKISNFIFGRLVELRSYF